jgi:hypothetical protein
LYTLGFRGDDLVGFSLQLNNPSRIAELQELEHWRTKFDVASGAAEGYFSKRWIAANLFGLTDDEIVRMQREMFFDRKLDAELNAVGEAVESGGGMSGDIDMGDDAAGDDDDFDLEADEPAEEPAAEEPAGDEDETLLTAPPGRRSDKPAIGEKYTTKGAKGKVYKKRGEGKKKSVARKYHMRSDAGDSYGKNTVTNTMPGLKDLSSLANGIFEAKETTYKNDENKILEASKELKDFAASLTENKRLEKLKNDDKA